MVLSLIQNIALLVALAATYQLVGSRFHRENPVHQILSGILFGMVGLVGMMTPVIFAPGIIFDGRSIILSLSGLFGGPLVAAMAAAICGAYRLWLGGVGAWVGFAVIMESATLGAVFHLVWRKTERHVTAPHLYGFSLLVHAVMLALMPALPGGVGMEVLRKIGLPIIVLYPVAGMVVGMIFLGYERQIRDREALRDSEERHRSLIEHLPQRIFIKDRHSVYLSCNANYAADLGITPEEIVGKDDFAFYPPELARVYRADDQACMESGLVKDIEEPYQLGGRKGWSHTIKVPYRDSQGRIVGVLGIFEDITDRKRAEDALRESETKYRSLFEGMGNAVAVYRCENDGKDFILVDFNRAAEEIERIPRGEVIGRSVQEVFPGVRAFGLLDVLERVWRTGRPERHPVALYRDERIQGWRDNYVYRLPTNEIVAVYSDETERKRAEEELRRSEEKFFLAFMTSPYAITITRPDDGRFVEVNEAFVTMTGFSREEALAGSSMDLGLWVDENDRRHVVETLLDGKRVISRECRFRKKNGEIAWGLLSADLIFLNDERCILSNLSDITRSKAMQEALLESENNLMSLLNAISEVAFLMKPDGRILVANEPMAARFSLKPADLVGRNIYDHLPPEIAARRRSWVKTVLSTGKPLSVVDEWRGRWVQHHLYPVFDAERAVDRLAVYATDITERRTAERKILLNEARLQSLYDISQYQAETVQDFLDFALTEAIKLTGSQVGCIYHYDEEKRLFELNTWSKEVMKQCEVAEPQTLYELDKTGIWGEAVRQRKPIVVNDFQAPHPLKKGYPEGHVELKNFMTIPVIVGGRIVSVVGVANKASGYDESDVRQLSLLMDSVWRITESKRSEMVRRRLATAVEHAAEGVMITDTRGRIEYVNQAYVEMTGYSRDELLGRTPRILRSGEHDEAFYAQFWRTITAGQVWTGRIVNRRKDGSLYTEEGTVSPVFDASGVIVNFVALKRDITQDLALSQQLLQAQKMESIGTLAGGVAHDFNNILQVVLGYTELILGEEGLPRRIATDLEKVYDSARRGAELVQGLLTFSRKAEPRLQPLNLNRRITEMRKMLERTVPKMIEIQLSLEEGLATIQADPTQVDQILMNLAVNARDAMPEGGTLRFETANVVLDEAYARTHIDVKPGDYVLLRVSDNGCGMDRDTLEHIFEPFFTTKAVGEGSGLGLATVHGIVKRHGGSIRCYSEPGHGTTFKILFPALVSEEKRDESFLREMPPGGCETILLVDDEELIRDFGSRLLTMAGYKVITACNGKEALEVYRERRHDIALVLLDLIMPEMGGRQCLEDLLSVNPAVKVIIASGFSAGDPIREALAAGAKGFVEKPYDLRQVLRVVRETLDAQ